MIRRRPRRSDLAALALICAALVPAACGDDEDEQDVTAAADRPVAEEFISRPDDETDAGGNADPADQGDPGGDGEGNGDEASEPGPLPSDFARRTIDGPLLRLYIRTGSDLVLDWWVIAAVDQIDLNSGNPTIPPRERIPGIGYSLAAAGAPHDNHAALADRAGGAYADRALALAGRLVDTVAEQREADGG